MAKIVGDVTRAIETELKPTLKSTGAHLGFCQALSEVNIRLGVKSVVFDPDEPGTVEVLKDGPRVCLDCGAVMQKRKATLASGELRVAWVCECDPAAVLVVPARDPVGAVRKLAAIVGVELPPVRDDENEEDL